ncbi:putative acetyltransferase [Granulicella sibirica]|uniref:Putative acetyltransferase n=1 Tax=Granulicella sibirica TaxID=2479048 RepID=A0A4Q0T784_9BACT|nr:putative acetyltransferase [Granulicella sibirica]
MNLRLAVVGDVDAICAIETIPAFRMFVGSWPAEQHRELMANPDARYFVLADEHGDVGGFAILRGMTSVHKSFEIVRLAVKEPNKGLGRVLLKACLAAAFEEYRAHRLWLDLFEGNERARHVYLSAGFTVDGVLRESILLDGEYYSMLLMSILEDEYRQSLLTPES